MVTTKQAAALEKLEKRAGRMTRRERQAAELAAQHAGRVAAHEAESKDCPDKGGRVAPAGKHWVKSVMGGWVLEDCGTPWTASVASETYWCS